MNLDLAFALARAADGRPVLQAKVVDLLEHGARRLAEGLHRDDGAAHQLARAVHVPDVLENVQAAAQLLHADGVVVVQLQLEHLRGGLLHQDVERLLPCGLQRVLHNLGLHLALRIGPYAQKRVRGSARNASIHGPQAPGLLQGHPQDTHRPLLQVGQRPGVRLRKHRHHDALRPDQKLHERVPDEGVQPVAHQVGREAASQGLAEIQVVLDDGGLGEGGRDGTKPGNLVHERGEGDAQGPAELQLGQLHHHLCRVPPELVQALQSNEQPDVGVALPAEDDLHDQPVRLLRVGPDSVDPERRLSKREVLEADAGDEGRLVLVHLGLDHFLDSAANGLVVEWPALLQNPVHPLHFLFVLERQPRGALVQELLQPVNARLDTKLVPGLRFVHSVLVEQEAHADADGDAAQRGEEHPEEAGGEELDDHGQEGEVAREGKLQDLDHVDALEGLAQLLGHAELGRLPQDGLPGGRLRLSLLQRLRDPPCLRDLLHRVGKSFRAFAGIFSLAGRFGQLGH
mmetsp:Transcript_41474/g.104279  ORF Transcript_41474/g.104279 Transcript_41474/m.104279 type:complete len:514 (+) Transcript_41474:729-2270(+)